jgi:thiosulfate/3-mercaptopyruvate sulfurtransferase
MRSRLTCFTLVVAVGVALSARPAVAATTDPARRSVDQFVVSTEWLAAHLRDRDLVIVEVVRDDTARVARIPGSRSLLYRHLTVRRDSLSTEVPTPDSLQSLFAGLGISNASRVIVYAAEAPMATRALMTLAFAGHDNAAYLDGGLPKWTAERRAVSAEVPAITRGAFVARVNPDVVVDADWIQPRLRGGGLALIDTRTAGEYAGAGNTSGMPSAGHLLGAQHLMWEMLFRDDQPLLLRDRDTLRALYAARVPAGSTVVTYCWVGYRGSATWFVSRVLGYNTRLYDGSYQDWQRRALPVTSGSAP